VEVIMANKHSSKSKKRVFLFGKRSIEALPDPEPGKRYPCQDTRNPYLFLRVTRNKKDTHTTKTFYWQRTINSKQKTVTIDNFRAINIDLARDRAEEIAARYTMGEDVEAEAREARSQLTLGELWADFRVNRKRGHGRISEAHEYVWERHFKPWEKKKVSDISYNMARKMILEIRKTAPIHGNRVQRLGKAIWNHGINELRVKGIENVWTFAQVSEKGRSRKTFRLQRADMATFMQALDALPGDNMRDLFLSSLFSGRRIGECKAMRWVDVDLEYGLWTIPDTKSGEAQTCVLPQPLVKLLQNRKPKNKSQWVFPAHSKTGHVEAINTAWGLVRSHGFQHLQARDLRGTLASWLQEAGVPLVGAQQQLGHADISTTAGSYTTISHSLQRIGMDSAVSAMLEAAK
jgi:integrase